MSSSSSSIIMSQIREALGKTLWFGLRKTFSGTWAFDNFLNYRTNRHIPLDIWHRSGYMFLWKLLFIENRCSVWSRRNLTVLESGLWAAFPTSPLQRYCMSFFECLQHVSSYSTKTPFHHLQNAKEDIWILPPILVEKEMRMYLQALNLKQWQLENSVRMVGRMLSVKSVQAFHSHVPKCA